MGSLARLAAALLLVAPLLSGPRSPAAAQLLYDAAGEHENYARIGYRPYTAGVFGRTTRNVYDGLGNFLMDGVQVYQLDEGRTDAPNPGSYLDKGVFYGAYLNRLVVAQDSYRNWSSRLIIGDRIRSKFTSLTLDMVALNGVRWDLDAAGTLFSVVASREDWPIYTDADNAQHSARDWVTYLLGGHVHRRFGLLDVSLSYVNQHRSNSLVSWSNNSLKGVLPSTNTPPAYIVVKVADDSDRDGQGARVFSLWVESIELEVAGQRVTVQTATDTAQVWRELFSPDITRHDTEVVDPTYPNRDQYMPEDRSIPPYVEYLRGLLPLRQPSGVEPQQADRTQYLLYWFKVPQDMRGRVRRIRFRADVANDYRIELAEIYLPGATASSSNPDLTGERATYFYTVAAAPGNVQDLSNRRQVEFSYGRQTGRTNVSVRVEIERQGFTLRSEYARAFEYQQYPVAGGSDRWQRESADAFFVNLRKGFGPLRLGGEYFRMSPRYSTVLSVEDPSFRSYTDMLNSPFSVFPNFPGRYNNTVEFSTVDDNDDRDRYPDVHFLPDFADADGVYPGLDLDQDGRPDTNENGNNSPDYLEPFLLYGSDPPEYDFGDDLNNNGIIDHREDDLKPDYPYDVDREGVHVFAELEPRDGLHLSLGHYDTQEIWRGGVNRVSYAKLRFARSVYPYGTFQLAHTLKRVHDDIEDDSPQFVPLISNAVPFEFRGGTTGVATRVLVEDPLDMRNSLVNTSYVQATVFRVRNLTLDGRLKLDVNQQRPTAYQPANTVFQWAWSWRTDYRWELGRLTVQPKVKLMGYVRRDDEALVRPLAESYFHPMLVLRYQLTPATHFSAGAQGLPVLPSRYWDHERGAVDYSSQDYLATVTNATTYNGYHLSLNMGYHLRLLRYDVRQRASEDLDQSLFFMRLIMGLEPFKG